MGEQVERRPILAPDFGQTRITTSTAASTALTTLGIVVMETTSTGAPVVYDLAALPKKGRHFALYAGVNASSSDAPFHVNAASGSFLGSSSEEMVALAISGQGAEFVGLSTSQWMCLSANGAVFSTST